MDKLDACTSLSRKLRLSGDTWNPYHSTLVHQQYIGNTTQVLFLLFNLKLLLLELNTLIFLSNLYKKFLTMVYLFQNIINLVSYQQIFAPNHLQVQLSVGVINWWLDSDSIQPVIHNTINWWDYMNFLWTKRIIKRIKISSMQRKFHQRYYVNFLISKYLSFNWQIHSRDW